MVGRQRGSSGYKSTRVRPVTIIRRPVCSLCVYTVYLWKQEHCFRKFSSLEIYGAILLVVYDKDYNSRNRSDVSVLH